MANEKRLIDANALGIGRCNPDLLPFGNRPYAAGWNGVVNIIDNAPTVDAVEVVHGRWVEIARDGTPFTVDRCSACGKNYFGFPTHEMNYCPNCGAKMDGETKFVGICEHCVYRENCDWPKLHPKIKLKKCLDFKKGDQK